MRYRNRKTGAIIDVSSALGGLWEPVVKQVNAPVPVVEAPVAEEKVETVVVEEKKAPAKRRARKTTKK